MRLGLIVLCDIPYIQSPQRRNPSQPVRPGLAQLPLLFPFTSCLLSQLPRSVVTLIVVRMVVLEKELLSNQVSGECDCRDAEAGEGALEAVPPGEGACVSPLLAAKL